MTLKIKLAWVWYSMLYSWLSTFDNHLKFRWYHYKFCVGRAKVFSPELYIQKWGADIRKMLEKYPGHVIPSHGLTVLLKIIETQQTQKVKAFLENEDFEQAASILIQELNDLNNANSEIEESPDNENVIIGNAGIIPENAPNKIHTRTFVIGLNIRYELYSTQEEYDLLKDNPAGYEDAIRFHFKVKNLSSSLYKHIRFDYLGVLKNRESKEMAQLKKQFEQIIHNPDIFGKPVVKRAKEIYLIHFRKRIGG
jgi:hypothetical protein